MPWRHGDDALLEVSIRTDDGLSFALYAVDGSNPARYVFITTRRV